MNLRIEERVLTEASHIIKTNQTVREMENIFKVSKSTIHKDLHERLKLIDFNKYEKVEKIMNEHIKLRHIKGGESTKKKYLKLKNTLSNI